MKIALFNELIKDAISPQCSQFVIVALTRGGMVHTNKLLWEFLIQKKEWIRARDENIVKQKEQATADRLKKLQKSAQEQIDDRVDERIAGKMDSTVVATVQNILVDNLNSNAFKNTGPRQHKKKHGSKPGDKKHKSGQSNLSTLQTKPSISVTTNTPQSAPMAMMNTILPTQLVQPVLQGATNQEQNFQFVT